MTKEAIHVADPGLDIQKVTPSDSTDLPGGVSRALLIGEAGDIKVTTALGNERTFYGVPGVLPLQVSRVWSTGTDNAANRNIAAIY